MEKTEKKVSLLKVFKNTFKAWNADDPFRQSAVIAYYAIFSLPALLVLLINVAGFFFEKEAISGEISRQVGDMMSAETAESVEGIVAQASEMKKGIISTIIAIVTIIFGATGVFVQLQKNLNQIWDVRQGEKKAFLHELMHRLFSFGLIITIGFLMLVSLAISSMMTAFSHWMESVFSEGIAVVVYIIDVAISLGVVTVLFALMYKFLPDVRVRWRYIWPGAFVTALLFTLGKYGLSFYFGKAEPESAYGAAGSIVLVLLWVSYSSMIVFFGAEFTKQHAVARGAKITAVRGAEKMKYDGNGQPVKENDADPAQPGSDAHRSPAAHHDFKTTKMKKITSMDFLNEEITRKKAIARHHEVIIKEKLRPARVLLDVFKKRNQAATPSPESVELRAEMVEYAMRILGEKLLFRNVGSKFRPVVTSLAGMALRGVVNGTAGSIVANIRDLFLKKRSGFDGTAHRPA